MPTIQKAHHLQKKVRRKKRLVVKKVNVVTNIRWVVTAKINRQAKA
jgi:fructose/tagatose bisphosphate aldolase